MFKLNTIPQTVRIVPSFSALDFVRSNKTLFFVCRQNCLAALIAIRS